MKLLRLSFRGLTTYAQPVSIDFDALGEGLVAVVGPNGAGKSTLLEAPFAALFKRFATRAGSLYEHCHGTDAYVEAVFLDGAGAEISVRLAIDAERRTTDGYILVDGAPVTDGKAAAFDAKVLRRFGSPDLLLASVFAAQDKGGSFLTLRKGDRKALFCELLGLGLLEQLAGRSRAERTSAEQALAGARSLAARVRDEIAPLDAARAELAQEIEAVALAGATLESARQAEAASSNVLERARSAGERAAALYDALAAAKREAVQLHIARTQAAQRLEAAEKEHAERIRFLDARKVEELEPAARRRHAAAVHALEDRAERLHAQLGALPVLEEALAGLAAAQAARDEANGGVVACADADAALRGAQEAEREASRAYQAAADRRDADLSRLRQQAARLASVPCTQAGAWYARLDAGHSAGEQSEVHPEDLAGTCPLLADARTAQDRIDLVEAEPPDAGPYRETVRIREAAQKARAELGAPPDLRAAEQAVATGQAALARAESGDALGEQLAAIAEQRNAADDSLEEMLEAARKDVQQAAAERARLDHDLEALRSVTTDHLAMHAAEISAAATREDAAREAWEAARRDAGDVTELTKAQGAAFERLRATEILERAAVAAEARARERVEQLARKAQELEDLVVKEAAAATELGDWQLLERGLGKDGVQALEIDAAAPEVTALVNELLASCYGPRFSVTLETLREKRDGEYSEAFDLKCFDRGQERSVEALSGGERVVVGEALSLAIGILQSRKLGVRYATWWRDETAGALDPENAQAYVRMLRRARQLSHAFQVIFVAHQREIWEAADARLVVQGGRVLTEAGVAP